ncbi:hypothetical protein C1890_20145 [Pseudomonas sp. DP16D-R1]|nr:hypothetical protein C1890_20145 [Pseudomonas sp. DP16D-R1]
MDVNDGACLQAKRGALESIAPGCRHRAVSALIRPQWALLSRHRCRSNSLPPSGADHPGS